MVNTIGDFIKSCFSSNVFNKDGVMFKSLLANENKNGVMEKLFNDLDKERKEWTEKDFYSLKGEQLEKILNLFSVLKKNANETLEFFLKRNELLFYRFGDRVWGTNWNLLRIFKSFFKTNDVWIVNNTDDFTNNLFVNGNFDDQTAWTLNNCVYSEELKLEGRQGVVFRQNGDLSQKINVDFNSTYFIHFFLKGKIKVEIIDNNNRYWKKSDDLKNFGEWSNTETFCEYESNEWNNISQFFITDDTINYVTVKFIYDGVETIIDYVRANLKTGTSTFSLIVLFGGSVTGETANLAPLKDDPNFNIIKYEIMSYFGNCFVYGATGQQSYERYLELLNIVRPAGVYASIEILSKE